MKKKTSNKNIKNYEYQKTHYRTFAVKFDRIKDKEIIDYIISKDNQVDYIRQLVKDDLKNGI